MLLQMDTIANQNTESAGMEKKIPATPSELFSNRVRYISEGVNFKVTVSYSQ